MAKYRKKPVVIEAYQFNGSSTDVAKITAWMEGGDCPRKGGIGTRDCGRTIEIETLEGMHTARMGDWIIKGVKGEFYPCKPDIFEMTYELVE